MDTQENDSILKEIMKGIANINVLLLSIKSFNQNDISKLSQKLNNISNEILDVAKKTKVIVSTEQTLINGEEEKKTSDKGTTSESNNVVEHGIRYLKAIPFSVIPAGNSIIEVLFKKMVFEFLSDSVRNETKKYLEKQIVKCTDVNELFNMDLEFTKEKIDALFNK